MNTELSLLRHIAKTADELLSLELERHQFYVLLKTGPLEIIKFPKRNFFSKLSKFYHTKIKKNALEFDEALVFIATQLRKVVTDYVQTIEKTQSLTIDHQEEAKRLELIFQEVEEIFHGILIEIKKSTTSERELFTRCLTDIQAIIRKEKSKILNPLVSYLHLTDLWKQKVEARSQDIFSKDLSEKVAFLKEAGLVLVKLVLEKNALGPWITVLDIEGKNELFQENADTIFQSILKDPAKNRIKGVEELGLFRAYINLLKNPKESMHFLDTMREAFLAKYQESIDQAEGKEDLFKLHAKKIDIEKKALLLKYKREEKDLKLNEIRKKVELMSQENPYSLPVGFDEIEKIKWPENSYASLKEKLTKVVNTLALIKSLEKENLSWRQIQEIRKKIFDFGILTPTTHELSNSLYATPNLLDTIEEIHRTISSQIASCKRDLLEINQDVENYSEKLKNEAEFLHLEEIVKTHQQKKQNFISKLIAQKGNRYPRMQEEKENISKGKIDSLQLFNEAKAFLENLILILKLDKDPLYLTKEDIESAFFLISSPYMTEVLQGKLPENLLHLKEEVAKGSFYIDEINSSPFLRLAREMERLRTTIKAWELVVLPINEIILFLKHSQKEETKKKELISLIKEKKINEKKLEFIEKEQENVENDLYVLEGVEAVLVESILLD